MLLLTFCVKNAEKCQNVKNQEEEKNYTTDKQTHKTDGHCDLETESANLVKILSTYLIFGIFDRRGEAGAVLHTAFVINYLSSKLNILRARDLQFWANVHGPLHVMCNMSHVTCQVKTYKKYKTS